jgi:ribosome-associated translation inhibitor RaiA
MIIEFHNMAGEVQDWIIGYIRSRLMHLHNKHKTISRVQVSLKRLSGTNYDWKVCEISLVIDDDFVSTSGNANSYEHAAREAIDELARKIDEYHINRQTVLPDVLPDTAVDSE